MTQRILDIRIHAAEADGAHPVSAHLRPDGAPIAARFRLPVEPGDIDQALHLMEAGLLGDPLVRQLGGRLFAALFTGELGAAYDAAWQGRAPPRFRLVVDPPALARIPWELLYDTERDRLLALRGTVVRGLPALDSVQPAQIELPLRVLIATASPPELPPISGWQEARAIQDDVRAWIRRGHLDVTPLHGASLEAIQNALREAEAAGRPFNVLHVAAHGGTDPERGTVHLLLEREGQAHVEPVEDPSYDRVDARALADVLAPYVRSGTDQRTDGTRAGLRVVFLNACQSLHSSAHVLAGGMAPALLELGLPALVGMQVEVFDDAAVAFARRFYNALSDGRPIDRALSDARQVTRPADPRDAAGMGVPLLYLQADDARVFDLPETPRLTADRRTWRPWLGHQLAEHVTPRKLIGAVVGLLSLVVTLYGLLQIEPVHWWVYGPPEMTGDLRIAVADFGRLEPNGNVIASEDGRDLAANVARTLEAELDQFSAALAEAAGDVQGDYLIDIDGPQETGRVAGDTPAERARNAERLLQAKRAQVLVTGLLATGTDRSSVQPEIYIDPAAVRLAEELAGEFAFGERIDVVGDVTANPVASRDLRRQVLDRTTTLAEVLVGLGYFLIGHYEEAEVHLGRADEAGTWNGSAGREVVKLFRGNVALRREDLDAARRHYEAARALNPAYARALLGLAEVRFLESHATCSADDADATGLRTARETAWDARDAEGTPDTADIDLKADFLVGRVALCLSQAGHEDGWDAAAGAFERVIAAFERAPEARWRRRERAALAHANLGLIHVLRAPSASEAAAEYEAALTDYDEALALNAELLPAMPEQAAVLRTWKAYIHLQREDCAAAERALAEAEAAFERAEQGSSREDEHETDRGDADRSFYAQVVAQHEAACSNGANK